MADHHFPTANRMSVTAGLALILVRWRVRLWSVLTKHFLGSLSGSTPIVGMVYSLDHAALGDKGARHIGQRVVVDPAAVVMHDFQAHYPPAFRSVHAFAEKKLFVLRDVCVGPQSGAVWLPQVRGVVQESVGCLDRFLLWPTAMRERLLPVDGRVLPGTFILSPPLQYYHWLLEILPNIIRGLAHDPKANILITPDAPQYAVDGLILLLGADAIHERLVICSTPVQVERLILPQLESEPRFLRSADIHLLLSTLRTRIAPSEQAPSLRLYISRSGSPKRRVENEEELEARLAAIGFQIVHNERLPLSEQIRLFSAADAIVGLHGAGLSNLIWARPACRILELFPCHTYNPCYAHLAATLGFPYEYHLCEPGATPGGRIPVDAVMQRLSSDA